MSAAANVREFVDKLSPFVLPPVLPSLLPPPPPQAARIDKNAMDANRTSCWHVPRIPLQTYY